MPEDMNIILELEKIDEGNVDDLLAQWAKLNDVNGKVKKEMERLKKKITIYIKERKWDRYTSKFTDISITISKYKKTVIDENQLTDMLTEAQLARIKREIIIERISIVTPKMRDKMKGYLNTRKIKGR